MASSDSSLCASVGCCTSAGEGRFMFSCVKDSMSDRSTCERIMSTSQCEESRKGNTTEGVLTHGQKIDRYHQ